MNEMKIKILTDTSCGLSRTEAESLGYEMIALPFLLDDVEYDEDKLAKQDFYKKLKDSKDIHTSQAPISFVLDTFDRLLKEYDKIVYLPITSGLSSSYETALTLLEDERYKDKVVVINHKTISVLQREVLSDVKKLIDKGVDLAKIKTLAEENAKNNRIYIAVDTLEYLKKGGRVSSLAAVAGNLLNIKPILFSNGNKFEVVKKTRGLKAAEDEMINILRKDIDELFKDVPMDKLSIGAAFTECEDEALKFKNNLESAFNTKVVMDELSTVIGCHIGSGAVAATIYKHIDED
ncbi:MAG: DegV family protein [Lachnospiraceae bacterium]|nr:DegV family protein [Lachnospiraceae bacterium]